MRGARSLVAIVWLALPVIGQAFNVYSFEEREDRAVLGTVAG